MSTLRTAGELRGFLADVLIGVRDGSIDANKANAIAKVSAQINQSLQTEVQAAIDLKKMGGETAVAGMMLIASPVEPAPQPAVAYVPPEPVQIAARVRADKDKIWCEQCEMNVTTGQAVNCKSKFCKAKAAA